MIARRQMHEFCQITAQNLRSGYRRLDGICTLIGHCLAGVGPGPCIPLDTLILMWLGRQPGFTDTAPDPDLPLHEFLARDEAYRRLCSHAHGLVGNPTGAAALRDDLFPGAGCWIRRTAGSDRFAASITLSGEFRAFDGVSRDEAAASIAATIRAYVARQEMAAPLYRMAAE